jgi:glucose-1-phosphate adenylyltransferase
MDYRPMLYHHIQSDAELTVGVRRVNAYETHRYGIVSVNNENRIVEFHEKPRRTRETLASMGIYIFRKDFLISLLQTSDFIDFGNEILPAMVERRHNVIAYTFPGYWADVGTIQAFWEANMSLLAENPALDLYDRAQRRACPVENWPQGAGQRQSAFQRLPRGWHCGAQRAFPRRLCGGRGHCA